MMFLHAALFLYFSVASALTAAQWRSQSIYQVLTDRFARTDGSTSASCDLNSYCGGTWRGIINHLDYIQGMGFTAVWISPVVKNIAQVTPDGASYHGYWAQDLYALNSNFGTAADLKALSDALHSRGMYLMVDVVPNHMAYAGCGTCVDYSTLSPLNVQSDYHPYCTVNYNDENSIRTCWLGSSNVELVDIKTEDTGVRTTLYNWVQSLVSNYSVDGLRIDTARHIEQSFFPGFESAAGVYTIGEIFDGDPNYVCPYQNYMSGMLNYPAWYWITQAFQSTSGSISNLVNGINQMITACKDTTLLGSVLENHDNVRFPSLTTDTSLIRNAITFTTLADGVPIIYEGQEQQYRGGATPNNREAVWSSGYSTSSSLYTLLSTLNKIRRQAISKDSGYLTYKARPVYSDSNTIVMRKGSTGSQILSIQTNRGSSGSATFTLSGSSSGYTAGLVVTDVLSCKTLTADGSGNLAISISGGQPQVLYPSSLLAGSGICGTQSSAPTTTTLSTVTKTSTSAASCASVTSVAVSFTVKIATQFGQNIKLAGSIAQLGSWDPTKAVALSASSYTSSNPIWTGTVNMTPGTSFQYKFLRVNTDGSVSWEADPNRSYTVSGGCAGTAAVNAVWQT